MPQANPMVKGTTKSPQSSARASDTVLGEKINALTSLLARVRELIRDWGTRSAAQEDSAALAGASYYHELCRWLDEEMARVQREIHAKGGAVDAKPLQDARDELRVILAFSPADLLKARADTRSGRVVTLDEMRRELQSRGR
jgi:hypothetical protein